MESEMNVKSTPEIVQAAQASTVLEAALAYQRMGFSVLPLQGKRPVCPDWKQYQQQAVDLKTIHTWHYANLLKNVGLVCGMVSSHRVVLDLDGAAGYPAFAATFPYLAETYTVATGGGVGKHIYWQVDEIPDAVKAMGTPIGNLEMCAEGRQVVAPPSIHPTTGQAYRVEKPVDILRVANLKEVVEWIESFKKNVQPDRHWQPPNDLPAAGGDLNPRLLEVVSQHFAGHGYKHYGDWLHGQCIYPNNHQHGDRHPSFGYNTRSGYGFCYRCGTMLTKDICSTLGIHPDDYGGLLLATPKHHRLSGTSASLSDAPMDDPQENMGDENRNQDIDGVADRQPPDDDQPPRISDLKLPNWLQMYLDWAGTTGNQTPMSFHLAAGLWLLSVAVGRRLYGEAPWGIKIYPNLYLMLIASTTYYRKSTAYKLAEQIARNAIPHMLMPTPGSPERFQEALSGQFPANFDKLSEVQQQRLKQAQPFAAQRGLLKDEVAGLFGTINKRDYMTGMKDLLMELFDCPEYSDKDTQAGLTIVENAALSILGVTTPSGLSAAVSDADWSNGLLIRFALLTPELDYAERPPAKVYKAAPQELIDGLRKLHEKLPQPQKDEEKGGLRPPADLRLEVQCWDECQSYSEHLRTLCNPRLDTALDERLKGVYGRMHVQAFKLASLLAVLDWLETETEHPIVTLEHWETGKAIAEIWRHSAAQLLYQMDRSGEAVQEQREQSKLLQLIRKEGTTGKGLRELYRTLNLPAKRARQLAQDLVRAGLIVERLQGRAEWYISSEFTD
jgi:Bifunctional DNA primase/polymerase, N-terminal/Protein of unknown function (DUF3987)